MNSEATNHQNADYVPDWAWERMYKNELQMVRAGSIGILLGLIPAPALVELAGMDQVPAVLTALVFFLSLFLLANCLASSDDTSFTDNSQGFDVLPLRAQKRLLSARRTMARAFAACGVISVLLAPILVAMTNQFATILVFLFAFLFGFCATFLPDDGNVELTEEEIAEGIVR